MKNYLKFIGKIISHFIKSFDDKVYLNIILLLLLSNFYNMAPEKKYDGWLVSNNFLKRSAAVFGHYFVFSLIVGFITFILFLILGISLFSIFVKNVNVNEILNNADWQNMLNGGEIRIIDGDSQVIISSGSGGGIHVNTGSID